jgi:deazaflavin-dependent oxidoreductase (nitroreductase family)
MASSRPVSWFFSRSLHYFDWAFLKLSGGRTTLTNILSGLPMLVLTTTGARSGLPRTLPLVFIPDPQDPHRFALIASNWGQAHHPGWYFNLKANPRATCSLDGRESLFIAHEANGDEYERFWQYAAELYFGYTLYKKRAGDRKIPILVLTAENT